MEDAGVYPLAEAGVYALAEAGPYASAGGGFPADGGLPFAPGPGSVAGSPSPASPGSDIVLVQTADFITPVLDDPYAFGQAAAANALSDIYAMGARPVTALNLAAFPADLLATPEGGEILAAILRGGRDKIEEAGAVLIGGHTIDDREPKYGLAVTGVALRSRLLLQSGGRPGDVLFLTKPIGAGLVISALKRDLLDAAALAELTEVLTALNSSGRDAALAVGARAATDITGFGLLGHLSNLVLASGVGAEIRASAVPVMTTALALATGKAEVFGGGARRNLDFVRGRVDLQATVEPWQLLLLSDPMTSGGLLVAVAEDKADTFADLLGRAWPSSGPGEALQKQNAGAPGYWRSRVGRLTSETGRIVVVS
jgi:selenide,water dikinase